ncbi:Hsp20/alpha crystallin family protein [Methylorubrum aminovorans]|uniref:Hsp20/alpha crystallin family protein n=1 Tax=Methylorubrum aminovorans TaxID=269069 RepID=UPI003D67C70E
MQIKDLIPWARKDGAPDAKSSEDNPIATLQREMNHVFENFWNRVGQFEWPWGSGEAKSDMVETDNAIEVSIELPGMEMKDIEVTVNDDMLTVGEEDRAPGGEEGVLPVRAQLRRDLPDNSAPSRCGWRKGAGILQERGSDDQAAPDTRGAGEDQAHRCQERLICHIGCRRFAASAQLRLISRRLVSPGSLFLRGGFEGE